MTPKFRAWDKDENKYIFPRTRPQLVLRPSGKITEGSTTPNVIVEFSTGRKDKNKKETFAGDICVGNWPYAKKCVVTWDEIRCGFYMQPVKDDGLLGKAAYDKGYKMNANKFEVIGNVHDNPELIEGV